MKAFQIKVQNNKEVGLIKLSLSPAPTYRQAGSPRGRGSRNLNEKT